MLAEEFLYTRHTHSICTHRVNAVKQWSLRLQTRNNVESRVVQNGGNIEGDLILQEYYYRVEASGCLATWTE